MVPLLSTFGENYSHDGNKMKIKFSYKTLGISLDRICDEFKFPLPDYVQKLMLIILKTFDDLDGATNSIANTKSFLIEVNEDFELQKNKIKSKLENLGFKLQKKEQSNIISKVYNQNLDKEMKSLKLLIRQKTDDNLRRNNFLRLDKNERNFKFNGKYLNKFKKAISSSLIQSYPENLSVLKDYCEKRKN